MINIHTRKKLKKMKELGFLCCVAAEQLIDAIDPSLIDQQKKWRRSNLQIEQKF